MPMTAHCTFFWNELMTWSVDKAKAFYQETLGWQYESHPMADGGTYTLCKAGDAMAAGIFEMKPGTGVRRRTGPLVSPTSRWMISTPGSQTSRRQAARSVARPSTCPMPAASPWSRTAPAPSSAGSHRSSGADARGGAQSTTRSSSAPAAPARPRPCCWPARATVCCFSTATASPATWGNRRT